MRKSKLRIVLPILADVVLLLLFIRFAVPNMSSLVGYDITEYENWSGELSDPVVYKFGAGCWEYTVVFVKMIVFILWQCILAKRRKLGKGLLWAAVIVHVLIGVLGSLYIYKYGDGYNILYLIQHIWG